MTQVIIFQLSCDVIKDVFVFFTSQMILTSKHDMRLAVNNEKKKMEDFCFGHVWPVIILRFDGIRKRPCATLKHNNFFLLSHERFALTHRHQHRLTSNCMNNSIQSVCSFLKLFWRTLKMERDVLMIKPTVRRNTVRVLCVPRWFTVTVG